MKTTLVIGASENTERYANKAVRRLMSHNIPVKALGLRKGKIGDVEILTGHPELKNIHTVTLYVGPRNQVSLYDYIISLRPKRIIFNPGTENRELERKAEVAGIDTVEGCTLVMLASGQY